MGAPNLVGFSNNIFILRIEMLHEDEYLMLKMPLS